MYVDFNMPTTLLLLVLLTQDILEVANYLALANVLELCQAHMRANIDLDNVMEVLPLADSLSLGPLKDAAFAFACRYFQAKGILLKLS